MVLVLPAILLVTLVIFMYPFIGLYSIILTIPFDSHFVSLGPVNLSASNALIVITLTAWLLALLLKRQSFKKDKNYLLLALIFLAALMSTFVAIDPDAHIRQLVTIIGCGLTYFLTVNLIKDTKTLNRVLLFLGLAIFMATAIAIIQSVGAKYFGSNLGFGRLWGYIGPGIPLPLPRVTSTWLDPNAYGLFLLTGLPALLYFALRSKTKKMGYIVLAVFVLFGLFLSYSRGAWIGLAASLVVIVLILLRQQSSKESWPIIIMGMGILLTGLLNSDVLFGPVATFMINLNPVAAMYRLELWGLAVDEFLAHPVLGVGFGGFLAQYGFVIHNIFFQILVSTGILGALPFLLLFAKTLQVGRSDLNNVVKVALFVSFIGLLAASFFISVFFHKNLWFLMGLIAVAAKIKKKDDY